MSGTRQSRKAGRRVLHSILLGLASVGLLSQHTAAATEPFVRVSLTLTGCSGTAVLVVGPVQSADNVGADRFGRSTESWSGGDVLFVVHPTGIPPGVQLLTEDGDSLFSAIAVDPEEGPQITPAQDFVEAILDCSVTPYRVVSITRGTVLMSDSAMPRPSPWTVIGLAILAASFMLLVVKRRLGS